MFERNQLLLLLPPLPFVSTLSNSARGISPTATLLPPPASRLSLRPPIPLFRRRLESCSDRPRRLDHPGAYAREGLAARARSGHSLQMQTAERLLSDSRSSKRLILAREAFVRICFRILTPDMPQQHAGRTEICFSKQGSQNKDGPSARTYLPLACPAASEL